ncbi:FG-GAP repeat domain-containing protein [Streptomyces sp. NPDC001744]|uniref:FG-GAP repeat domain-containing protein n=1 Tax=Streptomyces sp. NPDC001744 TaxID=3364606 RepID=UPI0036BCF2A3
MKTYLRRAGIALAGLLAVAAAQSTVAAPQAAAAVWPVASGSTVAGPLTTVPGSQARLEYSDLTSRADALQEANSVALKPRGIDKVLAAAELKGRQSCFTDPGDEILATSEGFCWNAEDTATTEWMPQGITSNTTPYAPVDGREIVIASWYKKENGAADQASRLTIANATDRSSITYNRVMLVEPTQNGTFQRLKTHADAAVWYKNRLYVGNGEGYWVFDLNRFWEVDPSKTYTGRGADGVFGAEGHTYVLPLVGKYHDPTKYDGSEDPDKAQCGTWRGNPTDRPCHVGASLDLSDGKPALVSVELVSRTQDNNVPVGYGGTIARWALDQETGLLEHAGVNAAGLPVAKPGTVLSSPILGAQGVVSHNGTYLIPATCPEYQPGGAVMNSCIYRALPGQPVQLWKRVSKHIESIAYDAARDHLWVSNESTQRVVERVGWPQFPGPLRLITDAGGDTGNDGKRDLFAVDRAGKLWRYDGDGKGGYGEPHLIGGGWDVMTKLVGAGDLNADGRPDLLAVDNNKQLRRYDGDGAGGLAPPQILGGGWDTIRLLTSAGDVTSDGVPDLFAVHNDGTLYRYAGNGNGGYAPRVALGGGWGIYSRIVGTGDLKTDGIPDLLAVHATNSHLYRYDGNGAGGHDLPQDLGGGWYVFDSFIGVGDLSGDGVNDLLVQETAPGDRATGIGTFKLYPGAGTGGFLPSRDWHF